MKRLVFLFLTTSIITASNAQIQWGVKAGLNLSKIAPGSLDYSFTNRSGLNAGFFANMPLCHSLVLQPEIIYSGQGTNETYTGARVYGSATTGSFSLNYINIPILVKYKLPLGLFAEAGPQIGFLASAKVDGNDIKSGFKSTDFSGVLGVGYLSMYKIGVDVRYCGGVTGIDKNQSSGEPTFKNKNIQIALFYMFGK